MEKQEKRTLIISYRYFPNRDTGAKRFSYLSHLMDKSKGNIHILTIKEKYLKIKDIGIPHGGKIHRAGFFPIPFFKNSNIFIRIYLRVAKYLNPIDNYWGWIIPSFLKGSLLIKRNNIDKIIITGPPFSPFVSSYFLSKIFNIKLIIDYRDPWFFNQKEQMNWGKNFNSKIERKIIKQASSVVFNSKAALNAYKNSMFGKDLGNKGNVITNGYLEKYVGPGEKLERNRKVILYAGNLYHDRKFSYLFQPLLQLCESGLMTRDEIKIHIFGNLLEQDMHELKKNDWEDLIVRHKQVPHKEIIKYMRGADILYLPQITFGEYAIPYKIYDYLSVKKPILAITKPGFAIDQFIKEISCGEVAYVNDNKSIYKALYQLLNTDKKYSYKIDKYLWENIYHEYNNIIESL